MFASGGKRVPDDLADRVVWLLEEAQAPLLFVVRVTISSSVLILMQKLPSLAELQREGWTKDSWTEDIRGDVRRVLNSWYPAMRLVIILFLFAALSFLYYEFDDPIDPIRLGMAGLMGLLLAIFFFYGLGAINRLRAYRRIKSELPLDVRIISDSLDIAVAGLIVFATWLVYILLAAVLNHRYPAIAALVLALPLALVIGLFSPIKLVLEQLRNLLDVQSDAT